MSFEYSKYLYNYSCVLIDVHKLTILQIVQIDSTKFCRLSVRLPPRLLTLLRLRLLILHLPRCPPQLFTPQIRLFHLLSQIPEPLPINLPSSKLIRKRHFLGKTPILLLHECIQHSCDESVACSNGINRCDRLESKVRRGRSPAWLRREYRGFTVELGEGLGAFGAPCADQDRVWLGVWDLGA